MINQNHITTRTTKHQQFQTTHARTQVSRREAAPSSPLPEVQTCRLGVVSGSANFAVFGQASPHGRIDPLASELSALHLHLVHLLFITSPRPTLSTINRRHKKNRVCRRTPAPFESKGTQSPIYACMLVSKVVPFFSQVAFSPRGGQALSRALGKRKEQADRVTPPLLHCGLPYARWRHRSSYGAIPRIHVSLRLHSPPPPPLPPFPLCLLLLLLCANLMSVTYTLYRRK